jgi:predicted lipid-binding transport protein (Tim44 family)
VIVLVVALAIAAGAPRVIEAFERPGGGQGYSGGGSSGDGSGGGGSGGRFGDRDSGDGGEALVLGFEFLQAAVVATRRAPLLMWPIWGILLLAGALWLYTSTGPDWTVASLKEDTFTRTLPRADLETLREVDADFSVVLFEDFVHALFARAHEARGRGRLDDLGAYLSPEARQSLARLASGLAAVDGIIVGALKYVRVGGLGADAGPAARVTVVLDIEANYTEVPEPREGANPSACWVTERWTLTRPRSARSRPPQRVRSFGCPACGAPLRARDTGACAHCGRAIDPSEFDWLVSAIRQVERRATAPALTADVRESGTHLDTVVDAAAAARLQAIENRDRAFTRTAFDSRVRHIFTELQPAWSALDLPRARPYLSDSLAQTWLFWFDAYRRAGLRNVSEGATVTGIELARVTSDRYFDAITVRVRATGLDDTVDEAGEIRAGSRENPRDYTEYWTLVRGHATTGTPRAETTCPRCGGPLAVNMGGACEHCGAHVSSGEFDWVLSRVEQDEAYQG